jgi:hypothetical protein
VRDFISGVEDIIKTSIEMSSINGLISEVRPNFEIIQVNSINYSVNKNFQVIKSADQLFYKDRVLYTDIKPEFVSGDVKETSKDLQVTNSEQQRKQDERGGNTKISESKLGCNWEGNLAHSMRFLVHIFNILDDSGAEEANRGASQQPQPAGQKPSKNKKKGKGGAGTHSQQQQPAVEGGTGSGSKLQQVIEQAKKTVENALNMGSGGGGERQPPEQKTELEELKERVEKLERITKKV